MWSFLIIAVTMAFIATIVKTALYHAERIQRIKHGYPLDDGCEKRPSYGKEPYIDYSDGRENR